MVSVWKSIKVKRYTIHSIRRIHILKYLATMLKTYRQNPNTNITLYNNICLQSAWFITLEKYTYNHIANISPIFLYIILNLRWSRLHYYDYFLKWKKYKFYTGNTLFFFLCIIKNIHVNEHHINFITNCNA